MEHYKGGQGGYEEQSWSGLSAGYFDGKKIRMKNPPAVMVHQGREDWTIM